MGKRQGEEKHGRPASPALDAGRGAAAAMSAWLPPALAALITFVFLSRVLQNGFVNWDDDFTLLLNANYRGFGWTQIKWMFTTFHMGHYQPLSWLTFALDYKLWGLDPEGYHLTSLLLHSANAAVFYAVALRLLRLAAPGPAGENPRGSYSSAVFAALVFSLHPLRVESVAWATERRDVLSGFFFLLTVLYYLRAGSDAASGRKRLAPAAAFYLLSLLSKGIGVSLPAVLIFLDLYPLRRLPGDPAQWLSPRYRGVWLEKLPFAALSLAAGAVGLAAQVATGATQFLNIGEQPAFAARAVQALYAVSFYLWKTLAPFNLLPLYERSYHAGGMHWVVITGAVAAAAAGIALFLLRRRLPGLLALLACYIAMLSPVLQLVPFGPYIVADRYSYLACLPWALLAGWAFLYGLRAFSRPAALLPAAALVAALGLLTWNQAGVWYSPETLWRHTLAGNPDSSIAHSNLGSILLDNQGKVEEAAGHFLRALKIRPGYAFAHYNYGNALSFQGRLDEAMEQYRHTLKLMPDYANAHFNLANALMHKDRLDEAIAHYRQAILLRPDFADAHNNLGVSLLRENKTGEAVEQFRETLRISPAHALARDTLAKIAEGSK